MFRDSGPHGVHITRYSMYRELGGMFRDAPSTLFVGERNAVMRFNSNARQTTYADNIAFRREIDRIEKALKKGGRYGPSRRIG